MTQPKTEGHHQFHCLPFNALSGEQVYQLMQLRSEVFVVEQACIYQDLDGKDTHPQALHVLVYKKASLVACARILPSGLSFDSPSIGRILVAQSSRGQNLGRQVIEYAIQMTENLWPKCSITIGAQTHLVALYQEFGFTKISADYLEDGIPHVDMRR